jgi:hypothetical protein
LSRKIKRNIVSCEQIGFCKGKRTSDHIFTLKTLIDKYTQQGPQRLHVYTCFVDFRKALSFDTVRHEEHFRIYHWLYFNISLRIESKLLALLFFKLLIASLISLVVIIEDWQLAVIYVNYSQKFLILVLITS